MNIISDITERFADARVKLNRKLKDVSRKLAKNMLDLIFLTKYKTYDVITKFLRI